MDKINKAPSVAGEQRKLAVRQTIENILRSWKKAHPLEVKAFFKQIADMRGSLARGKGMSKGGTMMVVGLIPAKVEAAMCNPLIKESFFGKKYSNKDHWQNDTLIFTEFCRVFSKWRVNETSRPVLNKSSPKGVDVEEKEQIGVDVWKKEISNLRLK